jgi:hypothetical protein
MTKLTHSGRTREFVSMIWRALRSSGRGGAARLFALVGLMIVGSAAPALAGPASFAFDLTPSAAAAACLPNARGEVRLTSHGPNQQMIVNVSGMPANTTFTVFVLQLPHGPFGLSWYQGDVATDTEGNGHGRFIGIFSDETFVVAPGVGNAPAVDTLDATTNPQTAPVHMLHLGMWFDSRADAVAAGCPGGQTPFNGDHTAGIQVMNTTNFPDDNGPIGQFTP